MTGANLGYDSGQTVPCPIYSVSKTSSEGSDRVLPEPGRIRVPLLLRVVVFLGD
jgi:hypothetical protein